MNKQNIRLGNPTVTFTRFCRKNYAIFVSLRKEIRIGVLTASTLLFANPDSVFAQVERQEGEKEERQMELDDVEVTASRVPLALNQAARTVTLITSEQIQQAPVNSVNDILKLAAGVDVRQRGGYGIQTDISINGGTHDQIVILLNGVNISSPHTGHLAADFPVSIDDIDHIEILEGAASRVYGTSAFSGAINIVTKHNDDNQLSLGAKGGSFGTFGTNAAATLNAGTLHNRLSGAFTRSDGGVANGDFEKFNAYYQGGVLANHTDVDWQLGMSGMNYGANTFYSGRFPNQYESNRRYMASVSAHSQGKVSLHPTLYFNRALDHYQLIRGTQTGENFHLTDVYGASLNASTTWALGTSVIGAEVRNEGILSTSLGRPLAETEYVDIPGRDGRYYTKRDNRTNICYFLEHDVVLEHFTISAGLMANMNTALDYRYRLYPGVDISYRPNNSLRLYASWNKAQRMPTFTDLYYKSPTQEGNIGLKPEETDEFNIGATFHQHGLRGEVRTFYRKQKNMIDWVMWPSDSTNNYTTFHASNFKADNMGFSLNGSIEFREWGNPNFPLNQLTASYTYIHQKRKDDVEVYASSYALDYLRHKLVLSLSSRIVSHLNALLTYRWQQRMGSFVQYTPTVDQEGNTTYAAATRPYDPYGLLDLKLSWDAPRYQLYLEANNLTSYRYYDIGNVRQPGFWVMVGAKINVNL